MGGLMMVVVVVQVIGSKFFTISIELILVCKKINKALAFVFENLKISWFTGIVRVQSSYISKLNISMVRIET
jgi:hypothetical protein